MSTVNIRREAGVAVLEIDNPPVNAWSLHVREALADALQSAAADASIDAIVLTGAQGIFPAGADINEFASGRGSMSPTLRDLQARMESIDKPLVAAIEGAALGGGFEIALTCHLRVAAPSARVGLPEVKLGLLPGAGGTQRFTRLAGPAAALDAITNGTHIPAPRARDLGLLDRIADDPLTTAIALGREVAAGKQPLTRAIDVTTHTASVDPALFSEARSKLKHRARGQLAPWKIVDCIEAACTRPKDEGLQFERAAFEECFRSPQRQALIHVFFAEREARKIPGISRAVEPQPVRRAGVLGAGTMGAGIAMSFANAGLPVRLLDVSADALERGMVVIKKNYAASVARGSLTQEQADASAARITPVKEFADLESVDIAVEAVFEDLHVKQDVFRKLDAACGPEAILATNTSTLDIDAIAAATSRPGSVIGTHFFSPAHVMKLLENVRGTQTSTRTVVTAMSLGKRLGKITVLAGNCAGFIGNRMLQFYGREAEFLLEEGATPEQIDRVIENFGFAMGPLAVRDLAGNDVGLAVRKSLAPPPDERTSPILERLVAQGRLGQKAGKGFYRYDGRQRQSDPQVQALIESVSAELGVVRRSIPDEEILDRLLHPLVNEGARIVAEGIAIRPSDVDVVYVNGYGFPAYRGGPLYWGEQIGLQRVVDTMRRLAATHGERWQPASLLVRLADSGAGWSTVGEATTPAGGS